MRHKDEMEQTLIIMVIHMDGIKDNGITGKE